MKKGHIILLVSILSLIGIALLVYWYVKRKKAAADTATATTSKTFDTDAFLAGKWGFQYDFGGAKGTESATIANKVYSIDGVPVYNLKNVTYDEATKTLKLTRVRISDNTEQPEEVLIIDAAKKTMTGKQGASTAVVYTKIA